MSFLCGVGRGLVTLALAGQALALGLEPGEQLGALPGLLPGADLGAHRVRLADQGVKDVRQQHVGQRPSVGDVGLYRPGGATDWQVFDEDGKPA